MPRPRFLKLDPAKQSAILDAARTEFSEHGFSSASQNRVIDAAGVSKGAMYYYFDDKDDLYTTVIRREFAGVGDQLRFGPVSSAEQFWAELEAMFARTTAFFERSPETMALARSLARSIGSYDAPAGALALIDEARAATEVVVKLGQQVGAVRNDLPMSLLVGIAWKAGEAMDLWFAEHWHELEPTEMLELYRKLIDIYKRIAAPMAD